MRVKQWPVSKVLLDGLYDPESNLSRLRGCQHVMRLIWEEVRSSVLIFLALIEWVSSSKAPAWLNVAQILIFDIIIIISLSRYWKI